MADRLAKSQGAQPDATRSGTTSRRDELTLELLRHLEWKRVELIVVRYFSATGLRAELTCIGADGGVDVYLYRAGENRPFSYVQCKACAPNNYVKVEEVRALHGSMAAARIEQGVFVTTSEFGETSRAYGQSNAIETINAGEFVQRFAAVSENVRRRILAEVTAGDYTTPTCASHDVKMVSRVRAKDGMHFWACPHHRCGRIINVRADTT